MVSTRTRQQSDVGGSRDGQSRKRPAVKLEPRFDFTVTESDRVPLLPSHPLTTISVKEEANEKTPTTSPGKRSRKSTVPTNTIVKSEASDAISESSVPKQCDNCFLEDSSRLFRCELCAQQVLCDTCCIGHIKSGHRIAQLDGYEPQICKTHSIICTRYCFRCAIAFCNGCLGRHKNHEAESSHRVATGIKNDLEDLLTRQRNAVSPVETTMNQIRFSIDSVRRRSAQYAQVVSDIEDSFQKVVVSLRNKFQESESSWFAAVERLQHDLSALKSMSDSKQKEILEILSRNQSSIIEGYLSNKEYWLEQQQKEEVLLDRNFLFRDHGLSIPDATDIERVLGEAIERIFPRFAPTTITEESVRSFLNDWGNICVYGELLYVSSADNITEISLTNMTKSRDLPLKVTGSAFCVDGDEIFSCWDGQLVKFDLKSGVPAKFETHTSKSKHDSVPCVIQGGCDYIKKTGNRAWIGGQGCILQFEVSQATVKQLANCTVDGLLAMDVSEQSGVVCAVQRASAVHLQFLDPAMRPVQHPQINVVHKEDVLATVLVRFCGVSKFAVLISNVIYLFKKAGEFWEPRRTYDHFRSFSIVNMEYLQSSDRLVMCCSDKRLRLIKLW